MTDIHLEVLGQLACYDCGTEQDPDLGPECILCGEELQWCCLCTQWLDRHCHAKDQPTRPDDTCEEFYPLLPGSTVQPVPDTELLLRTVDEIQIPLERVAQAGGLHYALEARYPEALHFEVASETRRRGMVILQGVRMWALTEGGDPSG